VDLWGMRSLQDRRMWAADRIHLTAEGHQRVAWQAAEVLGAGSGHDWATPLPPGPAVRRRVAVREDAQWVREYVGPWVGRRLRRRSSGDTVVPKRPQPGPVQPGPVQPGPVQPGPVQPGPVQPGPVQPGPVQPPQA
jgi:hypothetical protein